MRVQTPGLWVRGWGTRSRRQVWERRAGELVFGQVGCWMPAGHRKEMLRLEGGWGPECRPWVPGRWELPGEHAGWIQETSEDRTFGPGGAGTWKHLGPEQVPS